jgi:signal transduction histidine kinase
MTSERGRTGGPRTRSRTAARRLEILAEAGAALAAPLDYDARVSAIVDVVVRGLADVCLLDLVDTSGVPHRTTMAATDPERAAVAGRLSELSFDLSAVAQLAGEAMRTRRPQLMQRLSLSRGEDGDRIWRALGARSAMAVPLTAQGRVLGVLSLVSCGPAGRYNGDDLATAAELGRRAAAALDAAQLFQAAQEARARAESAARQAGYLERVSTHLSASLDYDTTLTRVTDLLVPTLADYCQLLLRDESQDGMTGDTVLFERVASASVDPARAMILRRLQRRAPLAITPHHPRMAGLERGEAVLAEPVDDDMLWSVAEDAEHFDALKSLGVRSFLALPLITPRGMLGIIACGQLGARRFNEEQIAVAREIAARAALAIDNARLFAGAQRAQALAEASDRSKATFLATMSHELRTPLAAVIGYAELLADEISGPLTSLQRTQIARISASARHLLALIEEILTFARLDAGPERLAVELVHVPTLIREATALIEPSALTRGLALHVELPDSGPVVTTDPRRVRQVLLNLLGNAVRYTDSGTIAVTACATPDGGVSVSVADTGIGIAPENVERIFTPFTQLDQTFTRRAGGTGLGLSVARRLTHLLGGTLTVDSTVGVGSTFTLRLPPHAPEVVDVAHTSEVQVPKPVIPADLPLASR